MTSIKYAPTRNGWAIALLSGAYRSGGTYYEVVRVNPQYKHVTIHRTGDLQKARALANREWVADKAA